MSATTGLPLTLTLKRPVLQKGSVSRESSFRWPLWFIGATRPGVYKITYRVVEDAGSEATPAARTVEVIASKRPVVTLIESSSVRAEVGVEYIDSGATAADNVDGDISDRVDVIGTVDKSTTGVFEVAFDVTDTAGNAATTVVERLPYSLLRHPKLP